VTAGSSAQVTNTDNFGKFNYYKDECLVKAGNKSTVSVFVGFGYCFTPTYTEVY
jgi:hypothetical protein